MTKPKTPAAVPPAILTAATGLLLPFVPSITPTALAEALERLDKPATPEIEKPLTRKQAAALLGISLPTLYRWQKDGKIRFAKVSRKCVRISPACIRELLEA